MKVLNEFYTNQDVYELTMLGIDGKHWESVGNDKYKVLDQSNFGIDNNCNWGWKNLTITRTEFIEDRTALDDKYDDMLAAWNDNVKAEHLFDGFNFNTENVVTQVAAVEAALGSYFEPLINGLVDDVEGTIASLKAALDSAGMQDVIEELNKQAKEYIANN